MMESKQQAFVSTENDVGTINWLYSLTTVRTAH